MLIPMSTGGQMQGFLDPMSALLVVGGATAATLVNFPLSQIQLALQSLQEIFNEDKHTPDEIGQLLVGLCEQARRYGVLSLEAEISKMPIDILRHGLQRVVDGVMPDALRQQMETELEMIEEKAEKSKAVFDGMAAYSPAFGMIGTIVGLIQMLLTMKDPSTLGAAMGLALVTTFYGAVLANLLFMPIGGKLRARCDKQLLLGQMSIHGLVAIASGENPSVVADMLTVFSSVAGVERRPEDWLGKSKAGAA